MNYYDMCGIKIRTKLDFSRFLYRCDTNSYDFEIVQDEDFFAEELLTHSEILYRRFVFGEFIPYEEFFQIDAKHYLLRWLTKYSFFIDFEKRLLIINSKFDGEVSAVLFSKILSFLLYLKGYSQLHGSAVRYQDKTICFIGESGSGKSTIASLCAMNGGKIITDDIVVFHPEDRMIKSGIPSVRLDPSLPLAKMAKKRCEEVDKLRVDVSNGLHYTKTSAADCFFFLEIDDNNKELSFDRLKGSEKMLYLLSNVYGKHFFKNVFSIFYTKNISVFTYFSQEIPMFKVYRHSETKPEDFFELIHSLVSILGKGGETFG